MPILNPDYSDLNYEAMAGKIGLKPKHIPMLIGSFLEESNAIIAALQESIENKDFEAIKSHAHSIKGSAGNLQFHEIYEMSKEMELAATLSDNSFEYSSYFHAISSAIQTIPN